MSRDLKYIGMDVHKEAIVIAVLNCTCLKTGWSEKRSIAEHPNRLSSEPA